MRSTCVAAAFLLTLAAAASAQQQPAPAVKAAPAPIALKRVFAREQQMLDAVKASNVEAFNRLAAGQFAYIDPAGIVTWTADRSSMLKDCTTTDITTEDVRTQRPVEGVMILTYKATIDQTCKGVKSPSPVYVMSVWQRTANTWKLAAHTETPAK